MEFVNKAVSDQGRLGTQGLGLRVSALGFGS